jgi:hypothetical protein
VPSSGCRKVAVVPTLTAAEEDQLLRSIDRSTLLVSTVAVINWLTEHRCIHRVNGCNNVALSQQLHGHNFYIGAAGNNSLYSNPNCGVIISACYTSASAQFSLIAGVPGCGNLIGWINNTLTLSTDGGTSWSTVPTAKVLDSVILPSSLSRCRC